MFSISLLKSKARLLIKSINLIRNSAPKMFLLCCIFVAGSSILPILAIKSSADIINDIVSQAENSQLYYSIVLWALVLFIHDLFSPVTSFLQSNLGDKAVFYINKSIINKSHSLVGIEHFEHTHFHNDLQIISTNAYNRPINLVVTLIGIFRDWYLILYCMSLLFFNISYISLIVLACVILQTKIATKIQSEMWFEPLGRSLRSKMMNYISNISVNQLASKELRLFPLGGYLHKKYIHLFEEIYSRMLKLRLKLIIWPILPSIILLMGNVYALFKAINLITDKTLEVGAIAKLFNVLCNSTPQYSVLGNKMDGYQDIYYFSKNTLISFLKLRIHSSQAKSFPY